MSLDLMYITNDINVAQIVDKAGVNRVWVDLEKEGKAERQKGNTVKSDHSVADVAKIKPYLTNSKLLVRINPINPNTKTEIEQVINNGADIIMLPYYKTLQEVKDFLSIIAGRTRTSLLLETKEAHECLLDTLEIDGIDEFHIGLNDLHLSYNKQFMFELLIDGTVQDIASKISNKGIPFGIGGIAKLGEGLLPADYIIAEHYRLGSTAAILSRSFCDSKYYIGTSDDFEKEFIEGVDDIRNYEKSLQEKESLFFKDNYIKIEKIIHDIVDKR